MAVDHYVIFQVDSQPYALPLAAVVRVGIARLGRELIELIGIPGAARP